MLKGNGRCLLPLLLWRRGRGEEAPLYFRRQTSDFRLSLSVEDGIRGVAGGIRRITRVGDVGGLAHFKAFWCPLFFRTPGSDDNGAVLRQEPDEPAAGGGEHHEPAEH